MTPELRRAAEALRALGHGDRKIAEILGLTYWDVRKDREARSKTTALALPPANGPKILLYDIETAPALVWTWEQWQTNVIDTEQDWYMLSFAYKWLGDTETDFVSIFQDPEFYPDSPNDLHVVKNLHSLFEQADATVAHNGDRFDTKKSNARFFHHRMSPPSPYIAIDTRKEYNRYFKDYSASLAEIGRRRGHGGKVTHAGFRDLWRPCMRGDAEAWGRMEAYNRQDVQLLENIYLDLLPWIGHPGKGGGLNLSLWAEDGQMVCKHCGSDDFQRRGFHPTNASVFQTIQCNKCGGYSRFPSRERSGTVR